MKKFIMCSMLLLVTAAFFSCSSADRDVGPPQTEEAIVYVKNLCAPSQSGCAYQFEQPAHVMIAPAVVTDFTTENKKTKVPEVNAVLPYNVDYEGLICPDDLFRPGSGMLLPINNQSSLLSGITGSSSGGIPLS